MNFLVLGSGDPLVEQQLEELRSPFAGYYNSQIGYNETLSHLMYAGADFLLSHLLSKLRNCSSLVKHYESDLSKVDTTVEAADRKDSGTKATRLRCRIAALATGHRE